MSLNDPLANVLSSIYNYEKLGKKELTTKNNSKLIRGVLTIMQEEGLVGSQEITEDGKGNILKINLLGSLNKTGVIKPRFKVKNTEFEKYEKRFLPAKDFGILIVSTSKGLMSHKNAKEQNIGGTLISFAY
ncbi:30S ribosomal protein S8 [Candidatus Woesearchaeota archaeon]|nr:30S ribosomal protein S8 [Candidatus Woesearchaeota archaeon]MCF7901352.1 30S ribosomal protein S8 [Candidatus Woesearchaeota archaeon]MCF8013352.1 30S ribosomal protein S8 [Candidatus Woesearchaeota archaeon]